MKRSGSSGSFSSLHSSRQRMKTSPGVLKQTRVPNDTKNEKKVISRSDRYTSGILRGQNPISIASPSKIFDHIPASNARVKHMRCGEFLHDVIEKEIDEKHKREMAAGRHGHEGWRTHSRRAHRNSFLKAQQQEHIPIETLVSFLLLIPRKKSCCTQV